MTAELRPDEPLRVPDGAINIKKNRKGEVESFELPDYVSDTWDEIDFDDEFWEDVYDEVEDEEEDSYESDAV